ncbi:MAG: C25 family cysteine peptidase [candidate division WOR-3 bacterium]
MNLVTLLISLVLSINFRDLEEVYGVLPVKKDLPFYMGKIYIGDDYIYEIESFKFTDSLIIKDTFPLFNGPFPLSKDKKILPRIENYPVFDIKIEREGKKSYISLLLYPYKFLNGKIIKYTSFRIYVIKKSPVNIKSIPSFPEKFECILITKKHNFNILKEYVKFREKFGYRILTFDVDSIIENTEGYDDPEKIRNFIKSMYLRHGIEYVFIVGDVNDVPIRYAYENSFWEPGYVPTTLYYADLNGSWDGDKDKIYGERDSDSVDAYPDIIVGWLPTSNPDIILNYIEKLKKIETPEIVEFSGGNFLFAASSIVSSNDGYGPRVLEWIEDNAFTDTQSIYKLYYPDSGSYSGNVWNGDEELNKITLSNNLNTGKYITMIHYDHGAYTLLGAGWLNGQIFNTFTINNLNSQTPFFFLSPSCAIGAFDQESIVEEWLENPLGPLVAIVNTRTGWTSQDYQLLSILQALIKNGAENIGIAWKNAMTGDPYFRKSLTLIGDPLTRIWVKKPESLRVSFKKINEQFVFNVKDRYGSNIKNVRITIYNRNSRIIGYTDETGFVELPLIRNGKIKISAFHPDYYLFYDTLIQNDIEILSIESQENLIKGNNFSLLLKLKNSGDSTLESVSIKAKDVKGLYLSQDSAFIDVINIGEIVNTKFIEGKILSENASFVIEIKSERPNLFKREIVILPVINDSFIIFGAKFKKSIIPETIIDSLILANFSSKIRNVKVLIDNLQKNILIEGKSIKVLENIYIPQDKGKIKISVYENEKLISEKIIKMENGEEVLNPQLDHTDIEPDYTNLFINSNEPFYAICLIKEKNNSYLYPFVFNRKVINLKNLTKSFVAELYFTNYTTTTLKKIITDTLYPVKIEKSFEIPMEGYMVFGGAKIYGVSSLKSGDLDGDNLEDIIIPSQLGYIFLLYGKGNFDTIQVEGSAIEGTPAVYDIDHDGKEEFTLGMIFGNNKTLLKFENGNITYLNGYSSRDVVIIEDSFPILFTSGNKIYRLNKNFGLKPGFPLNIEDYGTGFSINDIYQEYPGEEIIYGTYSNYIGIFTSEGIKLGSIDLDGISEVPPVTADLNGDGDIEIITATRDKGLFILDKNLNCLKNFQNLNSYSQPVISDLEDDGYFEIILYSSDGKIYIIDKNFNIINSYFTGVTNSRISPLVYDLFGDNKKEVILLTSQGHLFIFNSQLIPLTGYPIKLFGITNSTPLIADYNHDGINELYVKCGGTFYVLSLPGSKTFPYWCEKYSNRRNTSSIQLNSNLSKSNVKDFKLTFNPEEIGINYKLFDISGRLISKGNNMNMKELNLKNGIYFIKLFNKNKTQTKKFIRLK